MATKKDAIIPINSFFSDFFREAIKPIPKNAQYKAFAMNISNKEVQYYIVGNERGMVLEDIGKMLDTSASTVGRRFNELRKKLRISGDKFYLMEGQHYTYLERKYFESDFKSLSKKGKNSRYSLRGNDRPFIFFEGVTALIGFMRGEIRDEVYLCWNEKMHQEARKNRNILSTQTIMELPPFPGMYYSKSNIMCSSKSEVIVVNIFYDLGISLHRMDFYSKDKMKPLSREIIPEHWSGLNFDFFITTEPLTIIDVTTREPKNELKNAIKEEVCKIEGWKLFRIYDDEIRNLPLLENRIKKYFKITG